MDFAAFPNCIFWLQVSLSFILFPASITTRILLSHPCPSAGLCFPGISMLLFSFPPVVLAAPQLISVPASRCCSTVGSVTAPGQGYEQPWVKSVSAASACRWSSPHGPLGPMQASFHGCLASTQRRVWELPSFAVRRKESVADLPKRMPVRKIFHCQILLLLF